MTPVVPLRLFIVVNPVVSRRRRRRLYSILDRLRAGGAVLTIRETRHIGHAREMAAALSAHACDRVVVAGGDGTINEVVNGLALGDKTPPLALIPLGTANVLARETGQGTEPEKTVETLLRGRVERIALGCVNGRKFVQMAGIGFDAWSVRAVNPASKKRFGRLAYVAAGLKTWLGQPYGRYEVAIDGTHYAVESLIIANGRYYGGRFVIAPQARLGAPHFEVILFSRMGRTQLPLSLASSLAGRRAHGPGVRCVTGRSLRVRGTGFEPVQADGDIVGALPLDIDILPAALPILMPPTRAST